jgi:hypothetical protein
VRELRCRWKNCELCTQENDIKMNIREILCEDEDLFHVLQGKDKSREVF